MKDYYSILGIIATLVGVVVGAFLQYYFQNYFVQKKEIQQLKESLLREMRNHETALDLLVEFTDGESVDIKRYLKDPQCISYMNKLFFESMNNVEFAYRILNDRLGKRLHFDRSLEIIRKLLIDSYGHSLGHPGKDARHKSHKIRSKLTGLYESIRQKLMKSM